MADMLYQATKYMNAEDAMIAKGGKLKKREKHDRPPFGEGKEGGRDRRQKG